MVERRGWKNVSNEEGTNWKEPQTRSWRNTLRAYGPRSWNFKAQDVMINGYENKWTNLERKPRDSKYWYRTLSWVTIVYQRYILKIWDIYITELYDRPNRQEILEVEPEGRVDTVEKDMKELRYMKAAGSDVPGDVLVGRDGLRLVIQLTNNLYETIKWTRISLKLQWLP